MTRMIRIGLIIWLMFGTCRSQMDRDWSLEKFCAFHGGTFTLRSSHKDPNPVGDRCEVTFRYATGTDFLAQKFCEETVPYHMIKATHSERTTTCLAEAGLKCKKDWIQLYGRCYFMEKKLVTYQEAQTECGKHPGAKIAYMHRDILAMHWKNYYTKVPRIWVDASEVYKDNLVYNEGDNMMLVFDGVRYRVKSLSLIRVDGTAEKAMALCEYTPAMTRAESNYLLRRYSEIFYPGYTTSRGMFVRTAIHFSRAYDNLTIYKDYCEKAMKPILYGTKVDDVENSDEEKEFHDVLLAAGDIGMTFYLTKYVIVKERDLRDYKDCIPAGYRSDGFNYPFRSDAYIKCDGGDSASAVQLYSNDRTQLYFYFCSHALRGPAFCEAKIAVEDYGPCPAGYTEFLRPNGVKWCHKYFPEKLKMKEAEQKCVQDGGHLTGFENKTELEFLSQMMKADPTFVPFPPGNTVFLGAQRRDECRWGQSGITATGWRQQSECSREYVFLWKNYVASAPANFADFWVRQTEPNYAGEGENCLEMEEDGGNLGINDVDCESLRPYICGMEAAATS